MATEKLSTEEILVLARQQGAFGDEGASSSESAAAEPAPQAPDVAETPPTAEESKPAAAKSQPAAAPKSTADILAAARAQAGGKPAEAAPKAPAAGGAPKSTADILAAAKSQGASGASAKPASAKAPAAAAKSKPATAPVAAGEHPSVQEMVRAMHQGEPAAVAAAPAPDLKPRLPGKPPLPKKKDRVAISRREAFGAGISAGMAILLTPFAVGWLLMAVIGGLWTLLGARFMMPNLFVELPSNFKIGPPSDFPAGMVSQKFKATRGVWIINTDAYNGEQVIFALTSVCTHLGCTPNWLEGEQKFKCPCHGSGFYISGINFEGPAPRPLERAGIRLAEDGSLEVDKGVKFQEELGQWQDGKSFFQV